MMERIVGIDEAGRGCLIGPMVVCGICLEKGQEEKMKNLGVKDSKLLSPRQRESLAQVILEMAHSFHLALVTPQEIDQENLNTLTMNKTIEIITVLNPQEVYLDVPARGEGLNRYCRSVGWLAEKQGLKSLKVYGQNKADRDILIVGAASIIAKVNRDAQIKKLQAIYGDFGSGYPSDPKTREFAKQCLADSKPLPPIIRTKWATISHLRPDDRIR